MSSEYTSGAAVLVLGWSPEQAVRGLAGLGASVTCAVTAAEAEAAAASGAVSRLIVLSDPADVEAVISGLARFGLAPQDFSFVCSAHEFTVVAAAVVGALGGARAMPVPVAVALRDKFVQKALVREAHVSTAGCLVATGPAAVSVVVQELGGFPVVVKPVSGAGALNTVRLDTDEQTTAWARLAGPGPWLVEQFVRGSEVHIDGVVRNGQVRFLSVARYLHNLIELHDDSVLVGSALVDPQTEAGLYQSSKTLVGSVLAALGYRDGIYHLEAFEQPDGSLVFGECGGRVGGGRVDETVRRQFGVDLHEEWVLAALGLPSDPPPTAAERGSYGWVHLAVSPGVVRSTPELDLILAQPGVVAAELRIKSGDTVAEHRLDSRTRAARAVVTGRDRTQVRERIEALDRWFRGSVKVDRLREVEATS